MIIINSILPLFAIILTGWVFKKTKLLKEEVGTTLLHLAYYLLIPAILFQALLHIDFQEIWYGPFIWTVLTCMLSLLALLYAIFYYVQKKPVKVALLLATTATTNNTGYIGLPILYAVFGTQGVIPIALSYLFYLLSIAFTTTILEWVSEKGSNILSVGKKVGSGLIKSPPMITLIIALPLSYFQLGIAQVPDHYIAMFSQALTGTALFAIGLRLSFKSFVHNLKDTLFVTFVKLIVLPGMVLLTCHWMGIFPNWTVAAVIITALPAPTVWALIAKRHISEEPKEIKKIFEAISATLVLSIGTLIGWIFLLNKLFPID